MRERATELVDLACVVDEESAFRRLIAHEVSALGTGRIEDAGDGLGADAGLKIGAGEGAVDSSAGETVDQILADVGGKAVTSLHYFTG